MNMRLFKRLLLGLTLTLASMGAAHAHDSFSIGLNIGGPGYYGPPPGAYYAPPPVIYRAPPVVYFGAPPPVYYRPYEPRIYYREYDGGRYHHHDRGRHGGWR
ncbi:putative transmembrane protein [Methylovorus sp. MP688]|nr:putative transmembrane protein [Methylovorus sp. MP688]